MLSHKLAIALLYGITARAVPVIQPTTLHSTTASPTTSAAVSTGSSTFDATLLVGGTASGAHANTAIPPSETVAPALMFENPPQYENFQTGGAPQPIRGDGAGAFILGMRAPSLKRLYGWLI